MHFHTEIPRSTLETQNPLLNTRIRTRIPSSTLEFKDPHWNPKSHMNTYLHFHGLHSLRSTIQPHDLHCNQRGIEIPESMQESQDPHWNSRIHNVIPRSTLGSQATMHTTIPGSTLESKDPFWKSRIKFLNHSWISYLQTMHIVT